MEENFLISINLLRLRNASIKGVKNKDGKVVKCVIIPIEKNNIFISEKSGAYIGFTAYAKKDWDKGTHEVKKTLSKDEAENMTAEDKKNMPNVGSMRTWNFKKKANSTELNKKETKKKININEMPI